MYHYIPNCIPLCLIRKFRILYQHAARNTPTSKSELLKLQLGLLGISDIAWIKTEGSPIGFVPIFECARAEKFP